jgi:hypothetical protein
MNDLERLLNDEVVRLIDRLAASIPEGAAERIHAAMPALAQRIDGTDDRLATIRATLLEDYARWRSALADVENLWAVAAWRALAEEPATAGSQRAA